MMVTNSVRSVKIVGHAAGDISHPRDARVGSSGSRSQSGRNRGADFSGAPFRRDAKSLLDNPLIWLATMLALVGITIMVVGCGSGGYAGGGVTSLSKTAITIDAGQTFAIDATSTGSGTIAWNITGTCTGSACGTLTSSGTSATYTAPAGLTQQMKVTLTAGVAGTSSSQSIAVTINPDPTINSNLPAGTVNSPYTTTLTASGGTAPLRAVSVTGTLPAGLTFNATSGVISGTPTTAGTSNFTAQVVDSSDIPYTATVSQSIVIATSGTPTTITVSGSTPGATVGAAYSTSLTAAGGTGPYTFTLASGTLPAGLTLSSTGTISGTPTATGTSSFTVQAKDANNATGTGSFSITVAAATSTLTITTGTLPNGTVGVAYSSTIGASGGTSPYSCAITSGTLPAGLTLASNCAVTGTPTTAGTSSLTVKVTDSASNTASGTVTITIVAAPTLTITTGTLPGGTVGTAYTATIGVSGGTGPYTCTIASGTLPAGLTLGANCAVSGTPTTAGASNLTINATDSSSPVRSGSGPVSITITAAPTLTISTGTLPGGTVGTAYAATIGVTGGTGPYSCTIASGTLPAGLTLGANCAVSGTPTTAGTSNLTINATDSSSPVRSGSGPVSITITAAPSLTITTGTLPGGTVGTAYAATIGVTGGTGPYSCVIASGVLPAGLTLGPNCAVSGTPTTPGTSNLSITATDSSNPVRTGTGPVSITIAPAGLTITIGVLVDGTVGIPYSSIIGVLGGLGPIDCQITSGTLPAGLTLGAGCVVSGTPTTAGTVTITVKATDSSTPPLTVTANITITIHPAALTLSTLLLPNGTVGQPYTATVGVNGGTGPYTCSVASGTLPAGLSFTTGCNIAGTPTVAGTSIFTVRATDSSSPQQSVTGPETIIILPAIPLLTINAPPAGTVNVPYTGSIGVVGGTGPYTCTINSGTLPAGLSLGANCAITGTPTTAGSSTVNVTVKDSSLPLLSLTGNTTIVINPPTGGTLTLSNPPNATAGVPYTGTIGVAGGTGPYSCTINTGNLPAGLTLGANCAITGTPTTAGTSTINVTATDSATPQGNTTGNVSITVAAPAPLSLTGSLPNATVGLPYSQTLTATGGVGPYTYAVTAGTLPAGLTLSSAGVISGTPTAPGASSFTVTATDSEGTPQTASLPLVLLVVYPVTPNDPAFKGPYAFLFQGYDDVLAGVLAYQTATIGSFTADGAGVLNAGELDANHQSSTATGNTLSSNNFLGTYTIGTDYRGSMAVTALNADGTTGTTHIYAIALKAPVAPSTASARATMIESDSNQLQGTKGSGSILAQTTSSFTTGLTGSYAFGLSGDTPCLPSCTLGLIAGPVAAVGQIAVNGSGAITSGNSDANSGSTNYANSSVSGTYGSADGNGRLMLSMNTSGVPTAYPTDYAVYMVDANNAFVMSVDKHSSFILLAGTAASQTGTFSNASMTGAYVGYENSATNPGLVGATLSNVLNLSTATIFRGTDTGSGTCNTTNVDQGGLTGLVNGLTGLGSGSNILNAVLGTYASTGTSACTVTSTGRGVLAYPAPSGLLATTLALLGLGGNPPAPRVVYLTAPNTGYFLETGYAGLGHLEAQTGAPFSLATFNGTYITGSVPASSVASIDTAGTVTADGAGHGTTTSDLNIGVGTINVIQLGVGGTFNYTLTNATQGRYTYGTTVVYAISPTRFVSVDTNPLTTSPSISLLY